MMEPMSPKRGHEVRLDVRVRKLDCESDAARLRRGMDGTRGLINVKVNPSAARLTLLFDPTPRRRTI